MAKAYQCDRCNRFFDIDGLKIWSSKGLKIVQLNKCREVYTDLCPDCQNDLDEWFSRMNTENMEDTDDDTRNEAYQQRDQEAAEEA